VPRAQGGGRPHVGTHGIRHRSRPTLPTGIPVKVGMALTAHKTVAMFMRYVHTEDKPVRKAAELVANRRKTITGRNVPQRWQHDQEDACGGGAARRWLAGYAGIHGGIVEMPTRRASGGAQRQCADDGQLLGDRPPHREAEQQGKRRAGYGEQLMARLSADLTRVWAGLWREQPGEHAAVLPRIPSLRDFRHRLLDNELPDEKSQTVSGKFDLAELAQVFTLPWSAYVRLLVVKDTHARRFYETEALRGAGACASLTGRFGSQFYERTALSKDKAAMLVKGCGEARGCRHARRRDQRPVCAGVPDLKDEYSESIWRPP
jgi:hypothetical protein